MNSLSVLATLCSCFLLSSAQIHGSISSNPGGGQNVFSSFSKGFGTPGANANVGAFASGTVGLPPNVPSSPVTTGLFAGVNSNGHGLNLQHTNTPGVQSSLSQSAHANLLNRGNHNLDANAFHKHTSLNNGPKFNTVGGGLDYAHAAGHGASLGVSHIPKFQHTSVDLMGKANLWRSPNRATSLDLTGTASRVFSPFGNKNNFGSNIGLTHRF